MEKERKQLPSVKNVALTRPDGTSGRQNSGDESLERLVEELTKPENHNLLILINNMVINMQTKQDSKAEIEATPSPHRYDECMVCKRETFNDCAGIYYWGAVYCSICRGSLCHNHVIKKNYWFKASEKWCSICGCSLVVK